MPCAKRETTASFHSPQRNYGVSWPAKLPDVICVNAADNYGNMVDFAQTDTPRRRIYTLGEGVPSSERDAKSEETIHRSGTSFATPIAVGIAVIVLGLTHNTGDLDVPAEFESLKPRLRTQSGMESVRCKGRRSGPAHYILRRGSFSRSRS